MSKVQTPTVTQKFYKWFYDALTTGGKKILSKNDFVSLKKEAIIKLNESNGNRKYCDIALKQVMDNLRLKIPDEIIKQNLGSVNIKLTREEITPTPTPANTNPSPTNPIPNQSITQPTIIAQPHNPTQTNTPTVKLDKDGKPLPTPEEQKIITQQSATAIEQGLKHGFRTLISFYFKTGLIEGAKDDKGNDIAPKPTTIESYQEETDELAKSWGDYCYRNNVNVGKYFELAMLFITTLVVLGSPLLNALFFGRNKTKKEPEKKKDLGKAGE